MSSDKGKKFSLDEMTDMYEPNEEETQNEIPMVLLTEEEWNSLIATLGQMQALTDEMEMHRESQVSEKVRENGLRLNKSTTPPFIISK